MVAGRHVHADMLADMLADLAIPGRGLIYVVDREGVPRQAVGCALRVKQSLPPRVPKRAGSVDDSWTEGLHSEAHASPDACPDAVSPPLTTFGQGTRVLRHMASSSVCSGACDSADNPQMEKLCSEAHGLCRRVLRSVAQRLLR